MWQTKEQIKQRTAQDPEQIAERLHLLADQLRSLGWSLKEQKIDILQLDEQGMDLYCGDLTDELTAIQIKFKCLIEHYNSELLEFQQQSTQL